MDKPDKELGSSGAGEKENLPVSKVNRIIVLGTRVSGAYDLEEDFERYIKERGLNDYEVEAYRMADEVYEAIFGEKKVPSAKTVNRDKLPFGIIVMPEMRQTTESGMGMSFDTRETGFAAHIWSLGKKFGVPVLYIGDNYEREKVMEGFGKLLLGTGTED